MENQSSEKCPRCGEGRLRSWNELNEEAQMMARRLPGAAIYSARERETTHRWCVRCLYEESHGGQDKA